MSIEWPYMERAVMWSVVSVCKRHRLHCCKLSLSCDVCEGCFCCSTVSYSLRFMSWFTHTLSHSQRSYDSADMRTMKDTPSHVRGEISFIDSRSSWVSNLFVLHTDFFLSFMTGDNYSTLFFSDEVTESVPEWFWICWQGSNDSLTHSKKVN